MASIRDIRRRIKSVEKTRQITKAMQIVSATKFKKLEDKFRKSASYASQLNAMLANLSSVAEDYDHPVFEKREIKNKLLVVVASDKGLCGSYNTNIIKQAIKYLEDNQDEVNKKVLIIGKKAISSLRIAGADIVASYADSSGQVQYEQAVNIMNKIVSGFNQHEWDQVELLYAAYKSAVSCEVSSVTLMPFIIEQEERLKKEIDYIYEPNPMLILDKLIPKILNFRFYYYLLEAFTSEHSARMVSMKNATDNAGEVIDYLTLMRNKARQAAITKEISEIVGGVEALKG